MELKETGHQMIKAMQRMKSIHYWELIPDLTGAESFLLTTMVRNEDRLSKVSDISESAGMHPAAISRLMNSLENKGLIERTVGSSSRRVTQVHVTEHGRDVFNRNHQIMAGYWGEVLGNLPEADIMEMLRIWDEVMSGMEAVLDKQLTEAAEAPADGGQ